WTAERLTTRSQIVDYGIDPRNGEPLLCSLLGTVYRLRRSGTTGTAPPSLLSQTGAFTNMASLTPSVGVKPYEPNVSFWSDRAIKSRWFAIENTTDTATFSGAGNWTFPTGMVWMKHFDIETTPGVPATRRKLETRFLVKTAGGVYGLSYKWRDDQSEADLIPEQGETSAILNANPAQTWRFPSRGECLVCHTQTAGFALSFNTPQLNRTHTYDGDVQNQILALSAAGYLSASVTSVADYPAFAAASDASQSLEWRVRSYLSVNCVQCHQPGGASQGAWDARHTTRTDLANLINGSLVTPVHADNRFVVPDRPDLSMLLKRQQGDGVGRMPPLATSVRDTASEDLVIAWINSLDSRQSLAEWQTVHFGSPGAANAAATFDADGDGRTNYLEYLTGTHPNQPASAWTYGQTAIVTGQVQIQFVQPANRAAIVEVSTDLATWQPWNVSGNGPSFPAASTPRTITAATAGAERFFRVRFMEP
ncbi:MAG TPA: hypothetical protein VD994_14890, partial [Prosthecobacter sp.]|nr:hypothetical protein [Prosthecobacter sp.]